MDAKDQLIIRTLQQEGRLTNQELSERVHLSPSPCLRRLRALEAAGVIRGYAALVDAVSYGLSVTVFLRVRLDRHSHSHVQVFERAIHALDEVIDCHLMTGDWDYLLRILAVDMESYERFIRKKIHAIDGIGALETSFAYGTVKASHVYPPV